MMLQRTYLGLGVTAVLLLAQGASVRSEPPTITATENDGLEFAFGSGDGRQTVSLAELVAHVAAATKPRVTGTGDLTKTVDVTIGTMSPVRCLVVLLTHTII